MDRCEWVGNVGWMLIALGKLQRTGLFLDAGALQTEIDRGADWIARQSSERGDAAHPGLITLGVEGNISGYFGLLAACRREQAAVLADAIFQFGWDIVQRRFKAGTSDSATAIDVTGSWGVMFLRSIGRIQEALDSQGYAASIMRTASFDNTIHAYGDIAAPFTPSVEFAAQAASAGIKDADLIMHELLPLQIGNAGMSFGTFQGARDHFYGGSLPPWVTTMTGVSPTAWVHFALAFDPLRLTCYSRTMCWCRTLRSFASSTLLSCDRASTR